MQACFMTQWREMAVGSISHTSIRSLPRDLSMPQEEHEVSSRQRPVPCLGCRRSTLTLSATGNSMPWPSALTGDRKGVVEGMSEEVGGGRGVGGNERTTS